jgi:hypothetical protein
MHIDNVLNQLILWLCAKAMRQNQFTIRHCIKAMRQNQLTKLAVIPGKHKKPHSMGNLYVISFSSAIEAANQRNPHKPKTKKSGSSPDFSFYTQQIVTSPSAHSGAL